jgi:hypothetical protein
MKREFRCSFRDLHLDEGMPGSPVWLPRLASSGSPPAGRVVMQVSGQIFSIGW